jgi:hypothetical protein
VQDTGAGVLFSLPDPKLAPGTARSGKNRIRKIGIDFKGSLQKFLRKFFSVLILHCSRTRPVGVASKLGLTAAVSSGCQDPEHLGLGVGANWRVCNGCTRFRRHFVKVFNGAGGGSWRDGGSRESVNRRPKLTPDRREPIPAHTALQAGLVAEVTARGQAQARALEIAELIARKPPRSAELAKAAVLAAYQTTLDAGLDFERQAIRYAFTTSEPKGRYERFF